MILALGKKITVKANLLDAQTFPVDKLDSQSAIWASSNTAIATVVPNTTAQDSGANSLKASVTGVANGTCNITCTIGGVTGTLSVTVYTPALATMTVTLA